MGDSLDALLGLGPDPDEPTAGRGTERPTSGPDRGSPVRDGALGPEPGGDSSGGAPWASERSDDSQSEVLLSLPLTSIRPNPHQPRVEFDATALAELAASIVEAGVLQPVLVRRIDVGLYELIAGERRWRAAQRAGLSVIPALVRAADDRASLEQAVIENLHRTDLNALEEAAAYRQLVYEFSMTQEEVARRVGKSRPAVANVLRLLQLPAAVQRLVRSGELSAGHARALLALPDGELQEAVAVRAVKTGWSVREVEELVRAAVGRSDAEKKSPAVRERAKAASMLEIERLLADRLDTRVEVSLSGSKGRVVIEFADLDDLERVYQALAQPEADHFDR